MTWTSHPVAQICGEVRAPGDKSCSHRALILAGLAEGTSTISGLLEGDDVLRTADAMAALGAGVARTAPGQWRVEGRGRSGLTAPAAPLDFGNSGTGSRLVMGAVAGAGVEAGFTGDDSLRARPMDRILAPLREMGLRDDAPPSGRLPFRFLAGSQLRAIDYAPPVASAQVKSAILLAALGAQGTSQVREARATRDHTERMLRGFGASLDVKTEPGGARRVRLAGGEKLGGVETGVPGDPSSAAFLAAAALVSPKGNVLIEGVMSNSTRDGFFDVLGVFGAALGAEAAGEAAGERLIDLHVATPPRLVGAPVPERLVPAMIDEFPILAVVAAFAEGVTRVSGAQELRVKESDRIEAIIAMLRANGVTCAPAPDGFVVEGCAGPPPGGGRVETRHDHRIAMSALVMGTAAQAPVSIDDGSMIATSSPDFFSDMARLGADLRPA
ncbi:MAG: 3-phosphoshikimate 1-carboxyvinyltransferase [Pseudomonadota bacterium]